MGGCGLGSPSGGGVKFPPINQGSKVGLFWDVGGSSFENPWVGPQEERKFFGQLVKKRPLVLGTLKILGEVGR